MPTLTWLTRDVDLKRAGAAPYRLLEAVPELGAGDPAAGNMLIQGDNLDALKALLPYYAGRVKCIYIDPPYNTRSAFEHYDDNLQHAEWLAMIYPRLELLRDLLSEDGSIWVSIDDNEGHYLKVVLDEIFGRSNYISNIVWQKKYAPANDTLWISDSHDHIHCYALNKNVWRPNQLIRSEKSLSVYKNPDKDTRGLWRADNYTCSKNSTERPNLYYPIVNPHTGIETWPSKTRVWGYGEDIHRQHVAEGLIYWGKDGKGRVPALKRFLTSLKNDGIKAQSVWTWDEVGHNQDGRKEQLELESSEPFSNPKPEKLIDRIIHIATNPNDLVLDSFLGSGTTAAVAQKKRRRWIGIETGEHAETHCAPRLRKVIDGEQGGISESVGWTGGGGFRFYRLGEAVFADDGRINPAVRFPQLAAHVWFSEFGAPFDGDAATPWLGDDGTRGLALLFNGILGDKSAAGGNVLTSARLAIIRKASGGFDGPITVYGEASRLGLERLQAEQVTFKQTPYDVRAR